MPTASSVAGQSNGPAVDRAGAPVVDPTKNVLDLVSAAIQRQDDMSELRTKMQTQESAHLREMADLREQHVYRLQAKEADRLDAIRAVDIGAVNRAAEEAATRANTLAVQVAQSAETLRTQVAATATAAQVQLSAALEPIIKDIADLRRAQYEAQGQKTQVVEARGAGNYALAIAGGIFGFIGIIGSIIALVIANKP